MEVIDQFIVDLYEQIKGQYYQKQNNQQPLIEEKMLRMFLGRYTERYNQYSKSGVISKEQKRLHGKLTYELEAGELEKLFYEFLQDKQQAMLKRTSFPAPDRGKVFVVNSPERAKDEVFVEASNRGDDEVQKDKGIEGKVRKKGLREMPTQKAAALLYHYRGTLVTKINGPELAYDICEDWDSPKSGRALYNKSVDISKPHNRTTVPRRQDKGGLVACLDWVIEQLHDDDKAREAAIADKQALEEYVEKRFS